jgi:hypothetical protein
MPSIAENHSPSITFAGDSADFPIVIADDPAKSPTQAISPVTAQKSANKTVEKKSPEKGPEASVCHDSRSITPLPIPSDRN